MLNMTAKVKLTLSQVVDGSELHKVPWQDQVIGVTLFRKRDLQTILSYG
jgi:hypothetical protein